MRRLALGLILAALALAGCTSTTGGSGEPPSGRWTLPQAQEHYLTYVAQGNQDLDVLNRLLCTCITELDPQQLANACAALAADDLAFAHNLEAGPWPETATSAINALATVSKAQAKGNQACASATSLGSMRSRAASVVSGESQVAEVRRALDLPAAELAPTAPRSIVPTPPGRY